MPIGVATNEIPVGVEVVGPVYRDSDVIEICTRIAASLEEN